MSVEKCGEIITFTAFLRNFLALAGKIPALWIGPGEDLRRQRGDFVGGSLAGAGFRVFVVSSALEPSGNLDLIPDLAGRCMICGRTPQNTG